MTDCSQLQAVLDETQQELQLLLKDPLAYCQDQCDPGDEECIRQCMRNTGSRKQALEQEIADIEFSMGLCGTWSIIAHVIVEIGTNFEGSFTITSGFAELTGTMSSSDSEPNTPFTGSYDSGQRTIRLLRDINSTAVRYEDFRGNVDLSTNPPRMSGEMTLLYQPDYVGVNPVYAWSAQKQSNSPAL
jgi:hypothetical protein